MCLLCNKGVEEKVDCVRDAPDVVDVVQSHDVCGKGKRPVCGAVLHHTYDIHVTPTCMRASTMCMRASCMPACRIAHFMFGVCVLHCVSA